MELTDYLACPDCGGSLAARGEALRCTSCQREYEVRNGIPLLYPANFDEGHLREEEGLAQMMKRPRRNRRDRFSGEQWESSKREFWAMVRNSVGSPPASFVYLGCGYDTGFEEFQGRGDVFVNFDLVFSMLETLRHQYGARYCVAGDIGRLPFKHRSFDHVIAIDVIHHEIDKLPALLKGFRALLKPGGTLFLEDPNSWALFQMWKSVCLPRALHRELRKAYHTARRSDHKPAAYEFPTSVWQVTTILRGLGFTQITVHPNNAYPNIGRLGYGLYRLLGKSGWIRTYHNFHYMLSARYGAPSVTQSSGKGRESTMG